MFESLILGLVQGIAEWLPISSEAMIILVKQNFFPSGMNLEDLISFAIFLHLGTVLSVLVLYGKTFLSLLESLFKYKKSTQKNRQLIFFIFWVTCISGFIGFGLLAGVKKYSHIFSNTTIINIFVGIFLLITALFLYLGERKGGATKSISMKSTILTGLFQSLAVIPGISRSGSTVAAMALSGIKKEEALRLSFLLSVPIVLIANVVLNLDTFTTLKLTHIVALFSAFISGIVTMKILVALVERIRFSSFVLVFAALLLVFGLLS